MEETNVMTMEAPKMELTFDNPELKKVETPEFNEVRLTAEEEKVVNDFVKKIDVTNTDAVLSYGSETQKQLAAFSEQTLEAVKTKDMGEVGEMLTGLVGDLNGLDEEEKKGLFSIFKKKKTSLESMKIKYESVEANVEAVSEELQKHQVKLLSDAKLYDKMYDLNLQYFKQLSMYIVAGKRKLEEERTGTLADLQKKAAASNLPEDAQAAEDYAEKLSRFEKKIYDLELTRTIAMQTAPEIRMVQNSDIVMAEKIQSTIVNTIPLWKNQIVISMGLEHASQAAAAEKQVNDMTNTLLKSNAEKLKTATVETAKESERGIVDIETLKSTNETLISAMDEILTIQQEGREKRRNAEKDLAEIENQLKSKLLQAADSKGGR